VSTRLWEKNWKRCANATRFLWDGRSSKYIDPAQAKRGEGGANQEDGGQGGVEMPIRARKSHLERAAAGKGYSEETIEPKKTCQERKEGKSGGEKGRDALAAKELGEKRMTGRGRMILTSSKQKACTPKRRLSPKRNGKGGKEKKEQGRRGAKGE